MTRRRAATLLAAAAALAPLAARAEGPPAEPAQPQGANVATKDAADRLTVPVTIDGRGPYAFIVDTASDRTTISDRLAAELGLPSAGSVLVDSATAQGSADSVLLKRLKVGVRELAEVRAPVFKAVDIGADGLLGLDALDGQSIVMDFRAKRMSIVASNRRDEPGDIVVNARSKYGQLILVDASFEGEDLYVVIDTGGQMSIANTTLRRLVTRRRREDAAMNGQIISVSGVAADAQFETLPFVRVGGVAISNLVVGYADVFAFEKLGLKSKPAMLLGMDLLRRFDRVSVDFKARRVRFLLPRDAPSTFIPGFG